MNGLFTILSLIKWFEVSYFNEQNGHIQKTVFLYEISKSICRINSIENVRKRLIKSVCVRICKHTLCGKDMPNQRILTIGFVQLFSAIDFYFSVNKKTTNTFYCLYLLTKIKKISFLLKTCHNLPSIILNPWY